jgi:hypothetical protein
VRTERAGGARYYYGLSQLPLQELTLKRGRHGWSVRQQESLSPLALSPSEKALMVQHAQALVGTGRGAGGALPARHPGRPQRRPRQQRCPGAGAFIKAAAAGIRAEILRPSAIERLPEFDTLWLRAETAVGHYTFEFARRAERLKMPVIDSPRHLACSKQACLYELMVRSGVPMPPPPSVTRRGRQHGRAGAAPRSAADGEDLTGAQGAISPWPAMTSSSPACWTRAGPLRPAAGRAGSCRVRLRIGFLDGSPLFACRRYRPEPGNRIVAANTPST